MFAVFFELSQKGKFRDPGENPNVLSDEKAVSDERRSRSLASDEINPQINYSDLFTLSDVL